MSAFLEVPMRRLPPTVFLPHGEPRPDSLRSWFARIEDVSMAKAAARVAGLLGRRS